MNDLFEPFFINTYPKVKSLAIRFLKSEEDAEDVTQDIFMKLLKMPEIWQNDEINNKYIYAMTKNHVLNVIRRKNRELNYQQNLLKEDLHLDEFNLEQHLYAKELELIARYTVEQMPEQRKKIFKMNRIEGKSATEISESLKLSKRTVEHHIYLAVSELKKILILFLFFIK